ncbi:MAG: hypothetical protein ABI692_07900 [Terracoccus sp.]
MSASTKTILWIALAVVVLLVIFWVVMSSRRRRRLDERRFQAGELRAEAQEKTPLIQERADRASVTERIAADARAEADEKAATAATLEGQAHVQRAAAEGVKAERDDLAREADRIDPDVTTDDEGHRVGQHDEKSDQDSNQDSDHHSDHDAQQQSDEPADPDQRAETVSSSGAETVPGSGAVAAENTGVLGGASTLDDHDDEPDLADAQDPFATAGEEAAVAGYDEDMKKKKKSSTAQTQAPGISTEAAADLETPREDRTDEAEAVEQTSIGDGPPVATATQPKEVSVPALDERDDVLVAGGPPDNDPGDHRGQPWATTPGEPGLDKGDELADNTDEGFAAHTPSDAAPESGSETEAAASETAAPMEATASTADSADDAHEAVPPAPESPIESTDASADEPVAEEGNPNAEPDEASVAAGPTSVERRISGFDEVFDGGYGIGSAQPIHDGAQPLAHPVKAWVDRKSFVAPGDAGYDGAEPDVWFYNEDAARRAGFGRNDN